MRVFPITRELALRDRHCGSHRGLALARGRSDRSAPPMAMLDEQPKRRTRVAPHSRLVSDRENTRFPLKILLMTGS